MAIYLGSLELATGGGSTGTGLPVNSYAPFDVSNATGNPTGYNATTGLYTHPNGDFYIKTGKTIIDSANAYPDATGNLFAPVFDYVQQGGTNTNYTSGVITNNNGTTGYSFPKQYYAQDVFKYTGYNPMTITTESQAFPNNSGFGIPSYGTGDKFYGTTGINASTFKIMTYDVGTYAYSTTNISGVGGVGYSNGYEGSYNPTDGYVWMQGAQNGMTFLRINVSGTPFYVDTVSISVSGVNAFNTFTFNDIGQMYGIWNVNASRALYILDVSGGAGAATKLFEAPITNLGSYSSYGMNIYQNGTKLAVPTGFDQGPTNFYTMGKVVGDGTAKTGADSAKPLFLKIK